MLKPISPAPVSMTPRTNRASSGATMSTIAATIRFGIHRMTWFRSWLTWVSPRMFAAAIRKISRMTHLMTSAATTLGCQLVATLP